MSVLLQQLTLYILLSHVTTCMVSLLQRPTFRFASGISRSCVGSYPFRKYLVQPSSHFCIYRFHQLKPSAAPRSREASLATIMSGKKKTINERNSFLQGNTMLILIFKFLHRQRATTNRILWPEWSWQVNDLNEALCGVSGSVWILCLAYVTFLAAWLLIAALFSFLFFLHLSFNVSK